MTEVTEKLPRAFIFRRLHSFTGFWIVLFLIEHLIVNSQAALFIGDDGSGFVRAVNDIKNLPYLPFIELFLLGMPIAVHAIWGIEYIRTSKFNSYSTDGSKPALAQYPRNRAFTWQRLTSWILLIGIIAHVVQMRFLEYPAHAKRGTEEYYMVRLQKDQGLSTLSPRLGFELFDSADIKIFSSEIVKPKEGDNDTEHLVAQQRWHEDQEFLKALEKKSLKTGQVIAVAKNFGTAELLMVRDTFKSPLMIVLYTIFVLSAAFHGFNGLWTFMISWGVTLNQNSQRYMRWLANGLMFIIAGLGLAATWGTYWVNLKQ